MNKSKLISGIKETVAMFASPKTLFAVCVPFSLIGVIAAAGVASAVNVSNLDSNYSRIQSVSAPFLSCDPYPTEEMCLRDQDLNKKLIDSGVVHELKKQNAKLIHNDSPFGIFKILILDPEQMQATSDASMGIVIKMVEISLEELKASEGTEPEKIKSTENTLKVLGELKSDIRSQIDDIYDHWLNMAQPVLVYFWTLMFLLNLIIRRVWPCETAKEAEDKKIS